MPTPSLNLSDQIIMAVVDKIFAKSTGVVKCIKRDVVPGQVLNRLRTGFHLPLSGERQFDQSCGAPSPVGCSTTAALLGIKLSHPFAAVCVVWFQGSPLPHVSMIAYS